MITSVVDLSRQISAPSAQDLCINTPCVTPLTDNASVLRLFGQHKDMVSLPVVDNECPIGLINRSLFLSKMAKPYYSELYGKKSCISFMDASALIVDASTSIHALAAQAVAYGDKALAEGFIITRNGHYLGLGMGLDLMRLVSDMHARQYQQTMQSIEYASVIQRAMLGTSRQSLAEMLTDYGLVWQPRDHVGGDCYHFVSHDGGWLAAVVDCTGHGVPGAFMTLIFASAFERALALLGPRDPARLLQEINRRIKDALGQIDGGKTTPKSNDGCDAILLAADSAAGKLTWASARMPIFHGAASGEAITRLEGERMGVGYTDTPYDYTWRNQELALSGADMFAICTDGLIDQIGGERHIAWGKRSLQDFLHCNRAQPMQVLAEILLQEHAAYQGKQARRDDLTFFGFRA